MTIKRRFALPGAIADLVEARNQLRLHYKDTGLSFTLDGNLVGDLGEAIAAELFDLELVQLRSTAGIDGYAPDGRTVQVKATGTKRGPAFRQSETKADHLLFFELDFEAALGTIVFNGPERLATKSLPTGFKNQRMVSALQIRRADAEVSEQDRMLIAKPHLMLD